MTNLDVPNPEAVRPGQTSIAVSRLNNNHKPIRSHHHHELQPATTCANTDCDAVANVAAMAPDQQAPSDVDDAAAAAPPSSVLTHRQRTKADFDKIILEQYVNRDLLHTAAILDEQDRRLQSYTRMRNEVDDYRKVRTEYRQFFPPSRLYGKGYDGYGNGHTDGAVRVIYPSAKPRAGHRKTQRLRVKRKEMLQQADQVEELVPVRLDVDWDKIKLRDTFTWNIHDRTVPPDLFAAQLVEDLGLALPAAHPVLEQVQQQLDRLIRVSAREGLDQEIVAQPDSILADTLAALT